jgi:hypothetical protein
VPFHKETDRWLTAHDMNKFHPAMWGPYARHFYNPDGSKRTVMGPDGFQVYPPSTPEFNRAWLWHIKRSKHHPQYWTDIIFAPCRHKDDILLQDSGKATCLRCDRDYERLDSLQDTVYGRAFERVYVRMREMPVQYVTEMLCDWIGAGLAQGSPDTLTWYRTRGYKLPLHPNTRQLVESRIGATPTSISWKNPYTEKEE